MTVLGKICVLWKFLILLTFVLIECRDALRKTPAILPFAKWFQITAFITYVNLLMTKPRHCFYCIILIILWKKNFVQSFLVFWLVLSRLQSFQFGTSDVIPATVRNSYPWFLLILWRKNISHTFMVVLTISHELMKLRSFEWLNCVSM